MVDKPMPAPMDYAQKSVPDLEQRGYRAKPGTSISVKLDPGWLGTMDLRETVKEYLCCAKVPVYYNGERIGRTYRETMDAIHNLEHETVYELPPECKKKFDECFSACAGQYPKITVTIFPLDTEKNQMLSSLSGAFIKYNVKFEKSPHWQVKGRNYEVDAKIQVESSRLVLYTENADYSNAYLEWRNFITGHSPQEVKSLTAALEALPIPPESEDELGEAWHPFESEGMSPNAVWQMWMDKVQQKILKISFQELEIPAIDSLTEGRNCSVLTCSYQHTIEATATQLPDVQEQALDTYPMPDPTLTQNDLEKCGYLDGDLLPLSKKRAYELMERDLTVYIIQDGTPEMAFDTTDLDAHDGIFAVSCEEWEQSSEFHDLIKDRMNHQEEREQAFLDHQGDCFAIYQVGHDDPVNVRYMNLDWLKSHNLSVDRSNYDLIYTSPLNDSGSIMEKVEKLYEQFNLQKPVDYHSPSMSVSDIVAIKQNGIVSFYYCNSIGFSEIHNFIPPKSMAEQIAAAARHAQQISPSASMQHNRSDMER